MAMTFNMSSVDIRCSEYAKTELDTSMLSVQAKDFKERISAAIAREFEGAKELSTGEKKNQVRDGIREREKGSSFI